MKYLKQVLSILFGIGLLSVLVTSAFAYTMTVTIKPIHGESHSDIDVTSFHMNHTPTPHKGDTWTGVAHQRNITGTLTFEVKLGDEKDFENNMDQIMDMDFNCHVVKGDGKAPFHTYNIKRATIREITIEHKEVIGGILGVHEDANRDIAKIEIAYEEKPEQDTKTGGITASDDWESPV